VTLEPLGARLIVRPAATPDRVGSLYIPPEAEETFRSCQAEIVARGPDVSDWRLQPGAHVIVRRFGAAEIGDGLATIWEDDVIGIVAECDT